MDSGVRGIFHEKHRITRVVWLVQTRNNQFTWLCPGGRPSIVILPYQRCCQSSLLEQIRFHGRFFWLCLAMHCIVTAGPTYEPLDEVRRLTNFSTGRLGSELASFLTNQGHEATLLIGQLATFRGERHAKHVQTFSTTVDLRDRLRALGADSVGAVFHAAAVSDFTFGKTWTRSEHGDLTEVREGKISTRRGALLTELLPTPKIIAELRQYFPKAVLVGWKFEVDGSRADVVRLAQSQIEQCMTDACVANGRAYGEGFGLVTHGACEHLPELVQLFAALEKLIRPV